jgi:hypothetical protein
VAIEQLKKLFTAPSTITALTMKKALSFLYYAPAAWIDKIKLNSLEKTTVWMNE